MGGEAGRAPSGGLRSCACSRIGWGRHHHHQNKDALNDHLQAELESTPKHEMEIVMGDVNAKVSNVNTNYKKTMGKEG